MAEKLFSNTLKLESNKIKISEKKISALGISSARVTNAVIMAVVKDCKDGQPIRVDVQYDAADGQVIDYIIPQIGDKISINVTEELNCLIRQASQCSTNQQDDESICITFDSDIVLSNIDLFVEYIPEQIMHEGSAYVDFDVRAAGNGQINLATGLLRYKHPIGGEIGLVYNDWQASKRFTSVSDAQDKKKIYHHGVGKGFKLNVEQFLVKRTGTNNQTVYTYIDGEGNFHEFTEKYYYLDDNNKKIFVPRSNVKVSPDGKLSYAISKKHNVEVKVERKSTTDLVLEQDYSQFKHGQYLEQRQKEQIELEENVAALARQLKEYVVIDKATGKNNINTNELKNYFNKKDEMSIENYERFLNQISSSKLLLTASEAIQYTSLLLQQTSHKKVSAAGLKIPNSSYNPLTYYSDLDNKSENAFRNRKYDRKLINLRKLVNDLKEDYARLIKKSNYIQGATGLNYQYDAYMSYLQKNDYKYQDNCCADITGAGCEENLIYKKTHDKSVKNLSISLKHLQGDYCDLQAELEQINDDLDNYYRKVGDAAIQSEKESQKVVEQRLRIFQKEFSNRTDKLQQNINKFEAEINKFVEKKQRELTNRQIAMLVERSASNKADLEKYFKQFYNNRRQLTQMNWQFPTSFITNKEGIIMGFNKDGYLVCLFDNYENQTAIIYNKGHISSIQDSDNNVISFEYGKGKRIKKIITSDSKTHHLFYDNGLLTRIVDGNGEETHLSYAGNNLLKTVKDHHNFGVELKYDEYMRIVTVNQTSEISAVSDNVVTPSEPQTKLLANIDYNESHLTTSVTNHLDVTTTYNFDIVGKVVTMYEGKFTDPERSTRAKSFEYVDNKKSFSISDNLFGEDLLQNETDVKLHGTVKNVPQQAVKTIKVDIPDNDVTDFVFSVWAKADSAFVTSARSSLYSSDKLDETYKITDDEAKQNRKFEVSAQVAYEDGTKENFVAGFDWLITEWQYVAMPIEIKRDKKLASCTITLDYSYNVGTADFSCLSLHQGNWTYNEFDEEGKKTYSEDSASKTHTEYFYDEDSRLLKELLTDREGRTFESKYEYSATGALVRTISYNGTVTEHVFDEKGRETKQIVYNLEDPTSKLYTESIRDDKGVVTADVDQSGLYNSAEYTYDKDGENTVVADGKGNQTAYGYKDGQLVSISSSADGEESANKQSITANLLTKVTNGETEFHFSYDGWGRATKIEIANNTYAETEYVDDLTTKTTLANKDTSVTKQDKFGNTTEQTVNYSNKVVQKITNIYDEETHQLLQTAVDTNGKAEYNIKYTYDAKGNVVEEVKSGNFALTKKNTYTKDNDLQATEYDVNNETLTYEFETDHTPDKRSAKVVLPFGTKQTLAYDGLGRTREIALGNNLVKDVFYAKYGDHATDRVSSIWYGVNGVRKENTRYTYDKAGNIETVTDNGKLVARYSYDGLNRLVREDNVHFGTFTFQYDHAGNILRKTAYPFTLDEIITAEGTDCEYEYKQNGWKDQLTSFNGAKCSYDELGNPTIYRGYELNWQGRRLTKIDGVEYTYDASGIRTSKRSDNKEIKFFVDKNQIVAEQIVNKRSILNRYFIYGVDGIAGFRQNGKEYLFRKNVQGDVTHIYTVDGELVGQYVYDAWGNCKVLLDVDGIATANPFRYRSYYFDYETGLYYLQTRYYDPETGRFISADNIGYLSHKLIGGLNLYAYCNNNPIMRTDESGNSWKDFKNWISNTWNNVINWLYNNIGATGTVGAEIGHLDYYWFGSVEKGIGYSRTFGNNKPINFYFVAPDNPWEFWKYSVGIDVNINGYGAGISIGPETAFTIHAGKISIDRYINWIGRLGVKIAVEGQDGQYAYIKSENNIPETAVTVLAVIGLVYLTIQTCGATLPALIAVVEQILQFLQQGAPAL